MIKKRKKVTRHKGTHTHGRGFKKKARGKGHRGGIGNAGSGKRADHKKDAKNRIFGKSKTLRKLPTINLPVINLSDIAEKFKGKAEVNLSGFKILSSGELKEKMIIKASAASKSAIDKVKKAGGDILLE
jgi:large subunit ribosomal protein L15